MLPPAGAAAVQDGRGQHGDTVAVRHEIGVGAPRACRWAVGPARDPVEAGQPDPLRTEPAEAALRPGLSPQAGAEHDEVRPALTDRPIVQAVPFQGSGREALYHHVRPPDQAMSELQPGRGAEIQREAQLGRIEIGEELCAVQPRQAVLERRDQPEVIGVRRRLHPHHGGAVIG